MAASPAVYHYRARVGALTRAVRNGECAEGELTAAKRDLAAAKIANYVDRVLSEAPPLSDDQRNRLAELLRPVRRPADRTSVVADRLAELDGGDAA
ncbi:hypothetical protein FIV07_10310 [Mycobacterium sp. THAF192]|nr:hypothetical protein FIV07_10310 [Mycobacterium sp. THAF192]